MSSLDRDGMLLRGADGMLHRGVPGVSGWDRIERMDSDVLELIAAVRSAEGWCSSNWTAESCPRRGSMYTRARLATLFFSWAATGRRRHSVTRDGLVRCWYGGERERIEREARRALRPTANAADWAQRRRRFEAAVEAEERADWQTAALHYEALDARRTSTRAATRR